MAQSYANPGGSGDRKTVIQVSVVAPVTFGTPQSCVDGTTASGGSTLGNVGDITGGAIQFDFGSAKCVDEIKMYQANTNSHGTWRVQGSNNATDWNNIGDTFTLGGVATQTITTPNGNASAYRYWRLTGVSGATGVATGVFEFEFSISPLNGMDYWNTLGAGDRQASITVSKSSDLTISGSLSALIDGSTSATFYIVGPNQDVTNKWIQFDLGVGASKVINEILIWWKLNPANNDGTWKVQGSVNASDWADVGSSFTLGGIGTGNIFQRIALGNSTGYRYYRFLGVTGTSPPGSYPTMGEMTFQIGDPVTQSPVPIMFMHYARQRNRWRA